MCSLYTTTSKLRVFGLAIFGYLLLHVKGLTSSHIQAVFTKVNIVQTLSEIAHFRGGSGIFFMGRWLIPIGHQTTREVILSCLTAI